MHLKSHESFKPTKAKNKGRRDAPGLKTSQQIEFTRLTHADSTSMHISSTKV